MKNIVIAAGYATRLGELTANFPKPLLKIGQRSILERMLDDIDAIPEIDEHIIVTNHKFAHHFVEWKDSLPLREDGGSHYSKPITIIDDMTETNDTRLGAVCDLLFAMDILDKRQKVNGERPLAFRPSSLAATKWPDDMLVVAADNLLFFTFADFVKFAREKDSSCIMCHEQKELTKLQRTGVVVLDDNHRVLNMEEKPQQPKSTWAVPPFYIYLKKDLDLVRHSVENGCGKDAPGNLAHYLCDHTTMHAWKMQQDPNLPLSRGNEGVLRFDIGSLDTYKEACERFGK